MKLNQDYAELDLDLLGLASLAFDMQMALGNETRVRVLVEHEDLEGVLRYLNERADRASADIEQQLRSYRKELQRLAGEERNAS